MNGEICPKMELTPPVLSPFPYNQVRESAFKDKSNLCEKTSQILNVLVQIQSYMCIEKKFSDGGNFKISNRMLSVDLDAPQQAPQ